MDVRSAPELKVLLYWQPVAGATSYNVYQAVNPGLKAPSCPAVLPFDDSTAATSYSDDPNPGWYLKPIKGSGPRTWCYAVTAIVNGIESAQTAPVSITIGNSGYVFFVVRGPGKYDPADKCSGGPILPLPSMNLADYQTELYYQAPGSTVHHDFQTLNLFERNNLAIVWQAPNVATDGTVIPWDNTGTYGFKISSKLLKRQVVGYWAPNQDRIHNYYTQIGVAELVDPGQLDDGSQCAFSSSGVLDFWQNVTE